MPVEADDVRIGDRVKVTFKAAAGDAKVPMFTPITAINGAGAAMFSVQIESLVEHPDRASQFRARRASRP